MEVQEQVKEQPKLKIRFLRPGKNPRKYFDPVAMTELRDSIAAQGVIQPILVRPIGNGMYEIVAGERRYRAAKEVFGDEYEIPVHIKEMTDAEAEAAALAENAQRMDMSPTEEADQAAKVLGSANGNRDEAARVLGWSRTTLDKRLALTNCSDGVKNALNERKINLGHAEILAACPKARQESTIGKLLALPVLPSVAELKESLQNSARGLGDAIFDKTDCAGCNFNSDNQKVMFAEAITEGNCTNGECYDRKVEASVVATVHLLKEEFVKVEIVRPGENFILTPLRAEGATGVGIEQAKACKGCANYGAAVSMIPGSVGKTYRSQCYDTACNKSKVDARITAEKEAAKAAAAQANDAKATEGNAQAKSPGAPAPISKPAVHGVSQRVKDYREAQWRKILRKDLGRKHAANLVVLMALAVTGHGRNISGSELSKPIGKLIGQPISAASVKDAANAISLATVDNAGLMDQMIKLLACSATFDVEINVVVDLLNLIDTNMGEYWRIDADYLDLLTKSEIEAMAEEVGLRKSFDDKAWKSLLGGKKDALIKGLMDAKFDFTGVVPKSIHFKSAK